MSTASAMHHARVEQALSGGQAVRSALVASWARSASLHGLDPSRRRDPYRLTDAELRVAKEKSDPVIAHAAPHLDQLFQMVNGLGGCVVLADTDGVALDRRGHQAMDRDFEDAGLWTGTNWSEASAGTNAIGTCLAEGRAVTIHRDQHFLARNIGLSCSSAPVYDAEGRLAAVFDVSTARPEMAEAVATLIAQTVQEAARKTEADMFHAAFPRARIVMMPGLERGQGALLAVDADDLVIGATRSARLQMKVQGGAKFDPRPLADLLDVASHENMEAAARAVLARAMARAGGNVSAAARSLGVSRATLHRKLGRQ